ncbi:MAG: hypothetical protein IJP86_12120 [Synergistaceae bacterium]|nr:hypothetical protein [Synergistaceae bacterium]
MLDSAEGFSYYAFCDQDDVWKPEKLVTGVKAVRHQEELHGKNFPALWHSSLEFVTSSLEPMFVRRMDKRAATLESFMLRLQGRGCAMVFNARIRGLVLGADGSGIVRTSHDIMAMAVTYAFGGESDVRAGGLRSLQAAQQQHKPCSADILA